MIKPLSKTILLLNAIRSPYRLFYNFSSDQPGERQQLNRAENFYRNSIRKININDKGRGIFTEHHLYRLTKLTEKASQLPLLFEGYYNYLGHFTVISSKTVDRMLDKALSFQQAPLEPVLEVFHNHNYLSYFPAYQTTLKMITAAEKDPQSLYKFLRILMECPLIKFNKQIVEKLLDLIKNQELSVEVYSRVVKLLIQRSALHIIDQNIAREELLREIGSTLEDRMALSPNPNVKGNSIIQEFLDELNTREEKSEDFAATLATLGLFFRNPALYYNNLSMIKDQQRIETIFNYLENSSQQNINVTIEHIESQEASQAIRSRIQKLKSSREGSDQLQQEVQNQQQEEKKDQ